MVTLIFLLRNLHKAIYASGRIVLILWLLATGQINMLVSASQRDTKSGIGTMMRRTANCIITRATLWMYTRHPWFHSILNAQTTGHVRKKEFH
jgi:hypothetical protein